jgi:hypothetical protein
MAKRTVRIAQTLHFWTEIEGPDDREEYGALIDSMQEDGRLLKLVLEMEPVDVTSNWTIDMTEHIETSPSQCAAPHCERKATGKRAVVCEVCDAACCRTKCKEIHWVDAHGVADVEDALEAAPSVCAEPDCGRALDALGAQACELCDQIFCRWECLQVHHGDTHLAPVDAEPAEVN